MLYPCRCWNTTFQCMVPIYIWTINIYLANHCPAIQTKPSLNGGAMAPASASTRASVEMASDALLATGIPSFLSGLLVLKDLTHRGSGSHHVFEELPSYSPIPNPNLKKNNQQKVAKRGKTGNSYLFRYLRMLPPRNNDSKSSLDSSGWQTERPSEKPP